MKSLKRLKLLEDKFKFTTKFRSGTHGHGAKTMHHEIEADDFNHAHKILQSKTKKGTHSVVGGIYNMSKAEDRARHARQQASTYSTDKNPQYEPYKPKYVLSTKDRHEIQRKRLAAGEKFTFKESKLEQSFPAVAAYLKLRSFKQAHDDRMKKIKGMVDAHAQNKPIGKAAKKISGGNSDHSRAYDRIAGTRPFKMPGVNEAKDHVIIGNAGRGRQNMWPKSDAPTLHSKKEAEKIIAKISNRTNYGHSPIHYHAKHIDKAHEYISPGQPSWDGLHRLKGKK